MADYQVVQTVTGHGNYVTGTGDIHVTRVLDAEAERDRALLADLMGKVERFWIGSILDPLVTSREWIRLAGAAEAGAVASPLAQTLEMEQAAGRPWQAPAAGVDIEELYRAVGQALLILGEPGAGKTITLLKLAKALIVRARAAQELTEPVPVVLPLAGWGERCPPLEQWIAGELAEKYFVTCGQRLLGERRLVLLLDGLDEVRDDRQGACVAAINAFSRGVGCPGVVVCSRSQDYANLIDREPVARLRLYGAVRLLPLGEAQIRAYVDGFGPALAPLRRALDVDAELLALARTPLMLNLMAGACAEHGGALPPAAETGSDWLFQAYIRRMLARTRRPPGLPEAGGLITRLGWLARQGIGKRQPLILIERLQPSWLERPGHRALYLGLSRVLGGVLFGLVIGLCAWPDLQAGAVALTPSVRPLALGALLGALAGAVMALLEAFSGSSIARLPTAARIAALTLGFGVPWSAVGILFAVDAAADAATLWAEGVAWGVLGGLFFATRPSSSLDGDIRLPELLGWSWSGLSRGLIKGLIAGSLLGTLVALSFWATVPPDELPVYFAGMVLLGAFLGVAVGGPLGAFRGQPLIRPATPNRGVRETLKGTLLVLSLSAVGLGLVIALATTSVLDPASAGVLGLTLGLALGLATALWYGGLALVRHYSLRVVLAAGGYLPLRPVRLLDYACDLIFLIRVGGGWQFFHDLLRRHFASAGAAVSTRQGDPS